MKVLAKKYLVFRVLSLIFTIVFFMLMEEVKAESPLQIQALGGNCSNPDPSLAPIAKITSNAQSKILVGDSILYMSIESSTGVDRFIQSVQWQIDGAKIVNLPNLKQKWSKPGIHRLDLSVMDNCGNSHLSTQSFEVFPVGARANYVLNSNAIQTHNALILYQNGPSKAKEISVDWGDQSAPTLLRGKINFKTGDLSHIYNVAGTFHVTVHAKNDTSEDIKNLTIQVSDNPVKPNFDILNLYEIYHTMYLKKKALKIQTAVQDDQSVKRVFIDFGLVGDSVEATSIYANSKNKVTIQGVQYRKASLSYTYPDVLNYNVTISTVDENNEIATRSFPFTPLNKVPTISNKLSKMFAPICSDAGSSWSCLLQLNPLGVYYENDMLSSNIRSTFAVSDDGFIAHTQVYGLDSTKNSLNCVPVAGSDPAAIEYQVSCTIDKAAQFFYGCVQAVDNLGSTNKTCLKFSIKKFSTLP